MSGFTAKTVCKQVGCDKLALYNGGGYWYFVYNDPTRNRFKTLSVPTMRLNSIPLEQWISDGKEFVAKVEGK